MVTSVPSSTTITITMPSVETGSGATTSGGIRVQYYYPVGPAQQLGAFGWGIGQWSGTVSGEVTTTLDGAITDAAATSGITLADSTVIFLLQELLMFKLEQKKFLIQVLVVMY